jgi:hypothetical protein
VHPYSKWRCAFWRLVSLVELAILPRHPNALAALEEVLGATEALNLLEAKRGGDGRWGVDSRPYWGAPGLEGSNVEVVDWRGGGAKEMVTLNVLRVLRAVGRLHP